MRTIGIIITVLAAVGLSASVACAQPLPAATDAGALWSLARSSRHTHQFSTLITAHQVRELLSTDDGIRAAINWCKQTGVTKVYIETFRGGYQADRDTLQKAKRMFLAEKFDVSGCVTTTKMGKPSTGWKDNISCYTDQPTQAKLQAVFEYAASLFDEIMIDDFWFTDCACPQCDEARKAKTVTIGANIHPVTGNTWEDYRCELMTQLSRERILAPSKRVNPKVVVIIKYPQWYDHFHERGYEVIRETADFDRTWVGTETRDYADKRWGGTPQFEGYFIMRWLGGIGSRKCGGGWYDPYGTTEHTYLEQARQTVLGGARESMLFCYGSLLKDTGPRNIEVLRANIPELLSVAGEVSKRQAVGVAAYKPANSHPEKEARVFDFVGMMGIPLAPCHTFPTDAPAAFFSVHALKDPDLLAKLKNYIISGKRALITDGLAKELEGMINLNVANVQLLMVKGDPKSLLALPQSELDDIRAGLLKPLKVSFKAPNKVGLYLFRDGSRVIENFNDDAVTIEVNGVSQSVPARGWACTWKKSLKLR